MANFLRLFSPGQFRFNTPIFQRTQTHEPSGRRAVYQRSHTAQAEGGTPGARAHRTLQTSRHGTDRTVSARAHGAAARGTATLRDAPHLRPYELAAQAPRLREATPRLRQLALAVAELGQAGVARDEALAALRARAGDWFRDAFAQACGPFPRADALADPAAREALAHAIEDFVLVVHETVGQCHGGAAPTDEARAAAAEAAGRHAQALAHLSFASGGGPFTPVRDTDLSGHLDAVLDDALAGARATHQALGGREDAAAARPMTDALRAVVMGGAGVREAARQEGLKPRRVEAVLRALRAEIMRAREEGDLRVSNREFRALERLLASERTEDAAIAAECGLEPRTVQELRLFVLGPLLHRHTVGLAREAALLAGWERAEGDYHGRHRAERRALRAELLQPQGEPDADRVRLVATADRIRLDVFAERPGLAVHPEDLPACYFDPAHPQARERLVQAVLANVDEDPGRAHAALDALPALDPVSAVGAAWRESAPPVAGPAEDGAWRLAMTLAEQPVTAEILFERAAVADRSAQAVLALYLRAAAHLLAEYPGCAPTPHAVLALARTEGSLPARALLAAAAELAGEAPERIPERWTLHAFRNGFVSDAAGSLFAQHEARLERLSSWMEIATGERRPRRFLPLHPTSPLLALRQGYAGANLSPVAEESAQYEAALREALGETLRCVGEALDHPPAEGWAAQERACLIARHVQIDHWLTVTAGAPPDDVAVDAPTADAWLATALAAARGGLGRADVFAPRSSADVLTEMTLEQTLRGQVGHRLTREALGAWMEELKAVFARHGHAADWTQADAAWRQMLATATDMRVEPTREAIIHALTDLLSDLRLGSRLRLMGGHTVGIGTRGLSGTLSGILAGGAGLRMRVDLRAEAGRHAALELAVAPHSFEIFVGTMRIRNTHAGGGTGVLLGIGPWRLGAMGDAVLVGVDRRDASGLILRLPRKESTQAQTRIEFAELLQELLAARPDGKGVDHPGSLLRELLEKHPTLSVTVTGEYSERRVRSSIAGEASARVALGPWRLGGAATAIQEFNPSVRTRFRDLTGTIRVDGHSEGRGARTAGEVRATTNPTLGVGHGLRLGLPSAEAKESVELRIDGARRRYRLAEEDGRLKASACVRDMEFEQPQAFARTVVGDLDFWLPTAVKRAGLSDLDTEEARTAAREAVRNFLSDAERDFNGNQYFIARARLKAGVAKTIDDYQAFARLGERSTDPALQAEAARCRAQVEEILEDRASWEPRSLRVAERGIRQSGPQLSYFGLVATQETSEGIHVEDELKS